MITTLTKTFTIAVQGKKEINEVVTLLRILQEFVFTPSSIQWDEIISLEIILKGQDSSLGSVQPSPSRLRWKKCSWVRVMLQKSFICYKNKNQQGRDSSTHFTGIRLYTTIYTMG